MESEVQMKQKNIARISVFLCMLLLIFSASVSVYAETYYETNYYECRDGEVSLYREAGWGSWKIEEIDKSESSGKPFEHIVTAKENGGTDSLQFDIYFSAEDVKDEDYIYFYGDENDAMYYYNKYGKDALVQLYTKQTAQADSGAQITYGTPVFEEHQWDSFLKTDILVTADFDGDGQQENRNDTVYLSADMTSNGNYVIDKVLVFRSGSGLQLTQSQQDTAAEIVDEFSGYGYGDEMTGDYSDYDEDYTEGSISSEATAAAIITVVTVVLIIAAIAAALIIRVRRRRKMNGRVAAGPQYRSSGMYDSHEISGQYGMPEVQETKHRGSRLSGLRDMYRNRNREESGVGEIGEHLEQYGSGAGDIMQRPYGGDEQRYIDSLRTLYKSGLLTRAEMNEMIERHQVQSMRRREKRY